MHSGPQNNTRQQNRSTHTHTHTQVFFCHLYLLIRSTWLTESAHEHFSIFKISSLPIWRDQISSEVPFTHAVFFFFLLLPFKIIYIFYITYWPVGLYSLLWPNQDTVCSSVHWGMPQIWFVLSIPSSLLSKNKRELPKPTR